MHRPRYLSLFILAPVLAVLALSAAGCGGSEHDLMIRKFFTASATGDTGTLGNIATVSFDPERDGRATNVSFVSETPEQTRTLKIKEFSDAFRAAQAEEGDFSKKMKEYQDKNLEAINRVLKIEASGKGKPAGKDAQVQAEWTKWREDSKVVQKKVSEARLALASERKVADMSLPPDKDPTAFEAIEGKKEVTVTATVRKSDNTTGKQTLVLTLERVVLKDTAGKQIDGKWMITGIKPAA